MQFTGKIRPATYFPVIATIMLNMKIKTIIRWLLFSGIIGFGLIYLNSAAYSTWISGGPAAKYPHTWAQKRGGRVKSTLDSCKKYFQR